MENFRGIVQGLWENTEAQDLIEYSLLLAFVALAMLTVLTSTKASINSLWSKAASVLGSAATSAAS